MSNFVKLEMKNGIGYFNTDNILLVTPDCEFVGHCAIWCSNNEDENFVVKGTIKEIMDLLGRP